MDIFQPAAYIVQAVFTFATFVIFSGNRYRVKFCRQQVLGVFKSEAHLGKSAGTSCFTSVKNQTFEVFAPEVTDFVFTDHPSDAVDDITFSATVRPDHTRDPFIKVEYRFISKTFKTLDF